MTKDQFKPEPNSLWLVVYEYIYDVIRVSANGEGFFAPGQEPMWDFSAIQEWVCEIRPVVKNINKEQND